VIAIAEPIDADALRIRHEFLSRPDLRTSIEAVAVLLDLHPHHAREVLDSLASEGFLSRTEDGRYVRT
jgi:predicted transcriptional regulator of viral defense system